MKTMTKTPSTMDKFTARVAKARDEALKDMLGAGDGYDQESIETRVRQELEAMFENLLKTAMGVSERFGECEVDSRSPLHKMISTAASKIAEEALADFVKKNRTKLAKTLDAASRRAYREAYKEELYRIASERGAEDGRRDAEKFLKKLGAA